MLKKAAPALAVLSIVMTCILCVFMAQQRDQIQRLTLEQTQDEDNTLSSPYSPERSEAFQRETNARILALEGELGVLRRQLEARAAQGDDFDVLLDEDGAPATAPFSPAEQQALIAALNNPDAPVRERLRDVMREENAKLRDERQEERRTQMLIEIEERFTAFADLNKLDQRQRDVMLPKLKQESTQLFELRRARRDGDMTREEVREQVTSIRAETDAYIQDELSPDQLEIYTKAREDELSTGRGRGGRGGDEGGGRRGRGD